MDSHHPTLPDADLWKGAVPRNRPMAGMVSPEVSPRNSPLMGEGRRRREVKAAEGAEAPRSESPTVAQEERIKLKPLPNVNLEAEQTPEAPPRSPRGELISSASRSPRGGLTNSGSATLVSPAEKQGLSSSSPSVTSRTGKALASSKPPQESLHALPDFRGEGFIATSVLGQGGEGTVYCVRRITPEGLQYGDELVCKRRVCASLADANSGLQEALFTARVATHPCLVKIEATFLQQAGEIFYLGLGESLSDGSVCRYLAAICSGVWALHQHGLAHRDLKPENLFFVDPSRQMLLVGDLGLAASISRTLGDPTLKDVSGSWPWIAPEIVKRQPYSFAVDAWSVGVILFELLCGQSVTQLGLNLGELAAKSTGPWSALPFLDEHMLPSRPKELAQICIGLLNPDPAFRMPLSAVLKAPLLQSYFEMYSSSSASHKLNVGAICIRPMLPNDEDVCPLIAKALEYSPQFFYYSYNRPRALRYEVALGFMRPLVEEELRQGRVQLLQVKGKTIGALLFLPSGAPRTFTFGAMFKSMSSVFRLAGSDMFARCTSFGMQGLRRIKKCTQVDAYFLTQVCIDVGWQNKGYGKYFLNHTLIAWADVTLKAVETVVYDDRQVSFFQQFGFETVERWQLKDAPPAIFMRRPPPVSRVSNDALSLSPRLGRASARPASSMSFI